jgi:hypothetical protein
VWNHPNLYIFQPLANQALAKVTKLGRLSQSARDLQEKISQSPAQRRALANRFLGVNARDKTWWTSHAQAAQKQRREVSVSNRIVSQHTVQRKFDMRK